MLEFNGLFEEQRRFEGDQRARSLAARQLLQAQADCPRRSLSAIAGNAASARRLHVPAMQRSQK